MATIDIARALKDRQYFDSLAEAEKEVVRRASPVGRAELDDTELAAVAGGLEGGDQLAATTTTTKILNCPICPATLAPSSEPDDFCCCNC